MDKNELKKVILSYGDKIGAIAISLDYLSKGDFVIGYGFDDKEKKWKVYQNGERGMRMDANYLFESEEEALEYLYRVVLRYHEYDERDKERRRKIAAEKQK